MRVFAETGDERDVAAVLLDDDPRFGELGLHPVGVRIRLVDLVEGDDDRHLGRLGMADRLERLGHDAVIGRDDHDRDVRDPCTAGSHGRECLVAGRVQEHDPLAVLDHLARADVLGDPTALSRRDLGRADGIEQARLPVVDVPHDRHDGRPRLEKGRIVLLEEDLLGGLAGLGLFAVGPVRAGHVDGLGHFVAELAGDERCRVAVDELVDRREDPALDQLADDVRRVDAEQLRELLDGDRSGQLDRSTFARVQRLDTGARERALATRWLARAAPTASAAPTPGHALLLRSSLWSW